MQDFYASWPYPYNIEDYLSVAADIARKVISDPNRDKFVYVPLNEPDSNGYNKDEKLQTTGPWRQAGGYRRGRSSSMNTSKIRRIN